MTLAPLKKSWLGTCDQQGFIKERGQENVLCSYFLGGRSGPPPRVDHSKNMQSHYIAVWRKIERSNKFKAISLFYLQHKRRWTGVIFRSRSFPMDSAIDVYLFLFL